MRHVLSILFGALFTIGTAWGLGRVLFARLRVRLQPLEHELLAGVVGSAMLSVLIFGLCSVGMARQWVFLLVGAAALWVGYRSDGPGVRGWLTPDPSRRALNSVYASIYLVYAVIYLVNSVAPETSPDGQTYHLGLVYRFFQDHGFVRNTTSFYANMPLGVEMLFLDAFSFGRQSSATMVECLALLASPFLLVSYGRRRGFPAAAALLVFLAPIVGWSGSVAYNDVFLMVASFSVFYLLEIWREDRENIGLAVAAGLVAGFCFGIKYTGFPAILYLIVVMWRAPRALLVALASATFVAGPWLVKNWIWVGNPFSPFLNRWFPNPYFHVAFEDFTRTWYRRYDVADLRPWPWMITVTGRLGGQLGPWFLLAPIALIALKWKEGRRLLLAAAVFVIAYPSNIAARFLMPALPFIALAMARVAGPTLAVIVGAAAVLAWPGLTGKYDTEGNVRIGGFPWKAALRITPQDAYMGANSVQWITGQMLDTFVPTGKKILSTTPVGEGYSKSNVMVTYQSAEGDFLQDQLTLAWDGKLPRYRYTFPARSVTTLRLTKATSVHELRFYLGGQEMKPVRVNANPFRFDANLMIDGNPITRWTPWQDVRPEMYVEAFFAPGVTLDRFEIDGDTVQPEFPAKVETIENVPKPDLRQLATGVLRQHGISYLLTDEGNWVATDIRKNPEGWGMKFVTERAGNRLYYTGR